MILADYHNSNGEHKAKMVGCGHGRRTQTSAGNRRRNHRRTADDLFGGAQGSPRTDKMVAAAIQWAERIMKKFDAVVE
jgi:hypothetical protein